VTKFTKAQNARLADELALRDRKLRDDLRSAFLESGNGQYVDLVGIVHDQGDESVADMLSELKNTLVERHVLELREIESARNRLGDGSINRCRACSGEIGYERLVAYPMAVRCIDCQRQFDKTHKHESAPRL
jgi:RNA polymerase-binding transcription factor